MPQFAETVQGVSIPGHGGGPSPEEEAQLADRESALVVLGDYTGTCTERATLAIAARDAEAAKVAAAAAALTAQNVEDDPLTDGIAALVAQLPLAFPHTIMLSYPKQNLSVPFYNPCADGFQMT